MRGCVSRTERRHLVGYNSLAEELTTLTSKVATLRDTRDKLQADLDWAAHSDPAAVAAELATCRQTVDQMEIDVGAAAAQVAETRTLVGQLRNAAKRGRDPRYWFSNARTEAKLRLAAREAGLAALELETKDAKRRLDVARAALAAAEAEDSRHRRFDAELAAAETARLGKEVALLEMKREELAGRKAEVDRRIEAPLLELQKLVADRHRLQGELQTAKRTITRLTDDIERAEGIDKDISRAANSYEKKILHDKCQSKFGNGSPRSVIRTKRSERTQAERAVQSKQVQLDSVERNILKTEARLEHTDKWASRVIRSLVLDGSNLCFEGQQFIGLVALASLTKRLTASYEVTVVFDASIRRRLGIGDSDLHQALPEVKVHVVAAGQKADETILDAARDPVVYVVSNDRFADFGDKSAVRDDRIIRHEIINGRVLVHNLDIDETFA